MAALILTYILAAGPEIRRKRQLSKAALRLLENGYEVVESYHRTSKLFSPFSLSVRQAAAAMREVSEEISKFPVYELVNQGPHSPARRLIAMSTLLKSAVLMLEDSANRLDGGELPNDIGAKNEEFLDIALKNAEALMKGVVLGRPKPEDFIQ